MKTSVPLKAVGVCLYDDDDILFVCKNLCKAKSKTFSVLISSDGIHFYPYDDTGIILREDYGFESILSCGLLSLSRVGREYIAVYTRNDKEMPISCVARSSDAVHWYSDGEQAQVPEKAVAVSDYYFDENVVLYGGRGRIYAAVSKDLRTWHKYPHPVYRSKLEHIQMAHAEVIGDKIHLFYFSKKRKGNKYHIKLIRFPVDNPYHRIDSVPITIWSQDKEHQNKKITPIGLVNRGNIYLSYWQDENGNILVITHVFPDKPEKVISESLRFHVNKHPANPILKPIPEHSWESQAVFNAAAIYEEGKVHIIYRAVGDKGVSVLGYASSKDGVTIDERSPFPIYTPTQKFEGCIMPQPHHRAHKYISGISWGGIEDPRIAKIGDKIYLTYVAFDGVSPPRLAMSSISKDDFLAHRWRWETPVLISKPGEVNKSGAVLPEKINGKYYIFHRVFPNLLIDEVDSLDDFDGTKFLEGHYKITPRPHFWDSRKLGVGATPIKTEKGWLVIYHGVDDRDDRRYKIGAMLLDLNNPTKVLARTPYPIIEPDEYYENHLLKYGVVYPCGAVIKDNTLLIYYGGSDTVLCLATAKADSFIEKLSYQEQPILTRYSYSYLSYAQ